MTPSPEEAIAFEQLIVVRRQAKRRRKRLWVLSWLARHTQESVYHRLLHELRLERQETMRNWIRLNKHEHHELLQLIMKEDTKMRKAVTPFSFKDKYDTLNLKVVCKQTYTARH